jgi:hypothetical protein
LFEGSFVIFNPSEFIFLAQAHGVMLGIPVPVDVVVITEDIFQAKKTVIGTLPETAIHEGKELYAA